MALQITEANFQEVLAEGKPLMIDCWAEWCGPCKMMLPIVEDLAKVYEGKVTIAKMDAEENDDICEQYGITNLPTFLFFRNGELVNRRIGGCSKTDLQKMIDQLL